MADARETALGALADVLDHHRALGESAELAACDDPRERALARHLASGVLRWLTALEWLRDQLLDRPLRRRDRDVGRLILVGLHQLWRDRTPDHAAIHATAETCRAIGKPWAVGLVNAVLRRYQRENERLLAALGERVERHAHPDWLLAELRRDWPDDWMAVVAANNQQPPLWLRVNGQRTSRAAARKRLEEDGLAVRVHPWCDDALAVEPPRPVDELPGFAAGELSVQDPAAQLAADLLQPAPGLRVLDACAAPGGKTAHLLERCPGLDLLALDRDPMRLERVSDNLSRLGLRARLRAADAADTDAWWDGEPFDRVLLDAPCSATGVIRRHPDIKWLRTPQQVERAVAEQARLLRRLWPVLGPGGILVYATCSILERENARQINEFLADHAHAEPLDPDGFPGRPSEPGWQLLPGDGDVAGFGVDGFYYAILRRRD